MRRIVAGLLARRKCVGTGDFLVQLDHFLVARQGRAPLADGGGIIRPGVSAADGKPNTVRASAVNYGAYGYRYSPAANFIYDASYVKLREATITYSFPQTVISRMAPFKGLDISVIGRNLWIIHKNLPYADPEDGVSSGNLQGYQVGAYPTTRSIGFNVKLRF